LLDGRKPGVHQDDVDAALDDQGFQAFRLALAEKGGGARPTDAQRSPVRHLEVDGLGQANRLVEPGGGRMPIARRSVQQGMDGDATRRFLGSSAVRRGNAVG
jgi:hypothetical protein